MEFHRLKVITAHIYSLIISNNYNFEFESNERKVETLSVKNHRSHCQIQYLSPIEEKKSFFSVQCFLLKLL